MDSTPDSISDIAATAGGERPARPRSRLLALLHFSARLSIMRFLIVSFISTAVDYAVLFLLYARLPHTAPCSFLAVAAGYLVGTSVNFVLARRMVFQPSRFQMHVEFLLVATVAGIGLALTELITLFLTFHFGWHVLLAKTAAVLIVFCWNFLARRCLIYRGRGEDFETISKRLRA